MATLMTRTQYIIDMENSLVRRHNGHIPHHDNHKNYERKFQRDLFNARIDRKFLDYESEETPSQT